MTSRIVLWAFLSLIVGAAFGYYFGYNGGYDEAASLLNLSGPVR